MVTLELVTLSGIKFGEEVYEVILPTEEGQIAVFPHHMPLVSLAVPGVISIRRNSNDPDSKMEHFAIHGGVIEVNGNRVRVLVDEADHSDEVSEKEAAEALEAAQKMAKEAKDQVTADKARQMMSIQQSRLRVAELRRRKQR